ncbi:UNVERIFIED_CONTAM: hypothetical protein GTU68_062423, partial [Idotea baltica]|nr:hypothetical protein [Idotea baltica]
RTRDDHATELAEDYVEAIADLIARNGICRGVDLSREFGVTHVTVNRTIGRLERDGYVVTEPYRPIELTDKGRRLAELSHKRHQIVYDFLIAIGVDTATATIDSEGMEHHVSAKTLKAMKRLTEQTDIRTGSRTTGS